MKMSSQLQSLLLKTLIFYRGLKFNIAADVALLLLDDLYITLMFGH